MSLEECQEIAHDTSLSGQYAIAILNLGQRGPDHYSVSRLERAEFLIDQGRLSRADLIEVWRNGQVETVHIG